MSSNDHRDWDGEAQKLHRLKHDTGGFWTSISFLFFLQSSQMLGFGNFRKKEGPTNRHE